MRGFPLLRWQGMADPVVGGLAQRVSAVVTLGTGPCLAITNPADFSLCNRCSAITHGHRSGPPVASFAYLDAN